MYIPKPIDTGGIVLSEELETLAEVLAENVHEVWAQGRIADGWVYGAHKDDRKKTTPCLVPYRELPEEEKAFDRNTAMETLRLLTKLGYRITKKEQDENGK